MRRWERWVAVGVILVSLVHAGLGFYYGIPAWQMFAFIYSRYRYELTDARGEAVVLRDFVPHRAYLTWPPELAKIAVWLGEERPEHAPYRGWIMTWNGERWVRLHLNVDAPEP